MRQSEQTKKAQEVAAVRALFDRVLGGTEGLSFMSAEAPDVLVDGTPFGPVAVEVVEPTDQGLAAGMAGLAEMKHEIPKRLDAAGLSVLVQISTRDGFIAHLAQPSLRRRNLDLIVGLAAEHVAAGREGTAYRYDTLVERGIERILEVHIAGAESPSVITRASVIHGGGWIRERVRHAIASKNEKIAAYRNAVGTRPIWLLVLAGVRFAGGTQSDSARTGEYMSRFDRTFYVDAYDRTAFELRTRSD